MVVASNAVGNVHRRHFKKLPAKHRLPAKDESDEPIEESQEPPPGDPLRILHLIRKYTNPTVTEPTNLLGISGAMRVNLSPDDAVHRSNNIMANPGSFENRNNLRNQIQSSPIGSYGINIYLIILLCLVLLGSLFFSRSRKQRFVKNYAKLKSFTATV